MYVVDRVDLKLQTGYVVDMISCLSSGFNSRISLGDVSSNITHDHDKAKSSAGHEETEYGWGYPDTRAQLNIFLERLCTLAILTT